jgi:hypothetical protein
VAPARPQADTDRNAYGDANAEGRRNRKARISSDDRSGLTDSFPGLICDLPITLPRLLDGMPGIAANVIHHFASLFDQSAGRFLGLGRSFIHRILCPLFEISHRVIPPGHVSCETLP